VLHGEALGAMMALIDRSTPTSRWTAKRWRMACPT
jgi:hypothetical protein